MFMSKNVTTCHNKNFVSIFLLITAFKLLYVRQCGVQTLGRNSFISLRVMMARETCGPIDRGADLAPETRHCLHQQPG